MFQQIGRNLGFRGIFRIQREEMNTNYETAESFLRALRQDHPMNIFVSIFERSRFQQRKSDMGRIKSWLQNSLRFPMAAG